MTTPGALPVGNTGHVLDTVIVDQGLGLTHREAVTIGDPTSGPAFAGVSARPPGLSDYGLITRPLPQPMTQDTAGRQRASQLQTLFDGKTLNAEDTLKWHTLGTGAASFAGNAVTLAVDPGEYLVRQGKMFCPYYSGKPQQIETTFINFENEAGVVKRIGYFSSSAVAPYSASLDGEWLEADGSTYRLITSNAGTETHNIPWTEWDAYDEIAGYDWSTFTVDQFDFLWLGGAGGRLFMVINGAFMLVHSITDHAGYATNLIMASPNQPVRYEIRSTSGTGSLVAVCSQVSTEGADNNEQGEELGLYSSAIACNAIGTIYALHGVRKAAGFRDHQCVAESFGATVVTTTATPEAGMLLLLHNPTLSADLTWAAKSRIEEGVATTQTVSNVGRVLKAVPLSNSGITQAAPRAALAALTVGIDNSMGTLVLAYTPYTTNQSVAGSLNLIEY